jgi:hypothetical protein
VYIWESGLTKTIRFFPSPPIGAGEIGMSVGIDSTVAVEPATAAETEAGTEFACGTAVTTTVDVARASTSELHAISPIAAATLKIPTDNLNGSRINCIIPLKR